MTKRKKVAFLRFIATSILLITSLATSVRAQESTSVNVDKIIAKVDNYIVLKSDLEKAYLDYLSRGEFSAGNVKCGILQQLVQEKMFLAKSVIDSILVEDALVEAQLSSRMESVIARVGSVEELEKFYGKTREQLEEELFDDIREQMIIQKMQQEITSGLKVSPAEVKKFFNKIPKDSLPYFSTEVSASQIVIVPEAGKKQKEEVRKKMYEIKGRIIAGASFGQMAREYSDDPGSAAQGGQLPFFKRGDLAPEFEATAMSQKPGELSDPIETQFGYHLIEVQEKRGNTFRSRHILMMPQPSASDVESSRLFLDSLRTAILNDSISFQQAAKDHSDDQATSSNGGFFADGNGSLRVSVEQLDPTIFFTLDTMTIGDITKPEKFQQPDGSYAFRILYFKEKVAPHQANLKQDYQKIATATLNEKRSKILNKYFLEAKDKVYIDIDSEYDFCDLVD